MSVETMERMSKEELKKLNDNLTEISELEDIETLEGFDEEIHPLFAETKDLLLKAHESGYVNFNEDESKEEGGDKMTFWEWTSDAVDLVGTDFELVDPAS